MVVGFRTDSDVGYKGNDNFTVSVTRNEEASGEKESQKQEVSKINQIDGFLERNQHWFVALSSMTIIGVEGYWLTKKLG